MGKLGADGVVDSDPNLRILLGFNYIIWGFQLAK